MLADWQHSWSVHMCYFEQLSFIVLLELSIMFVFVSSMMAVLIWLRTLMRRLSRNSLQPTDWLWLLNSLRNLRAKYSVVRLRITFCCSSASQPRISRKSLIFTKGLLPTLRARLVMLIGHVCNLLIISALCQCLQLIRNCNIYWQIVILIVKQLELIMSMVLTLSSDLLSNASRDFSFKTCII